MSEFEDSLHDPKVVGEIVKKSKSPHLEAAERSRKLAQLAAVEGDIGESEALLREAAYHEGKAGDDATKARVAVTALRTLLDDDRKAEQAVRRPRGAEVDNVIPDAPPLPEDLGPAPQEILPPRDSVGD